MDEQRGWESCSSHLILWQTQGSQLNCLLNLWLLFIEDGSLKEMSWLCLNLLRSFHLPDLESHSLILKDFGDGEFDSHFLSFYQVWGTGPETTGKRNLKISRTQIQGANHPIRDMGDMKRIITNVIYQIAEVRWPFSTLRPCLFNTLIPVRRRDFYV